VNAISASKRLKLGKDFDIVEYGNIYGCAHAFNFVSVQRYMAPSQNDELENAVKFWAFCSSRATE